MGQSTYIRRGKNVSRDQLREPKRRFGGSLRPQTPFGHTATNPCTSYASSMCPPNRPEGRDPDGVGVFKKAPAPLCGHISSLGPLFGSQKVGRSLAHAARMLASPPVGRANDFSARLGASLFLPPIRDEPRLKMQICCRMQSEASQPANQQGGSARGGQQMGPPQSRHSNPLTLADYMASCAHPIPPPLLALLLHLLINVRNMGAKKALHALRWSTALDCHHCGPLLAAV